MGGREAILTDEETAALRSTPDIKQPRENVPEHDDAVIAHLVENGRATISDVAARARIAPATARQRIDDLTSSGVIRLATELDIRLLGIRTEALIWSHVEPTRLEDIGTTLARHSQVRFAAATTGPINLLLAVAVRDRRNLYDYLTESLGAVIVGGTVDVSLILTTAKRTGLTRAAHRGEPPPR